MIKNRCPDRLAVDGSMVVDPFGWHRPGTLVGLPTTVHNFAAEFGIDFHRASQAKRKETVLDITKSDIAMRGDQLDRAINPA